MSNEKDGDSLRGLKNEATASFFDRPLRSLFEAARGDPAEPSPGFAKKVMSTIDREPVRLSILQLASREQIFVRRFTAAALVCASLALVLIYRGTASSSGSDDPVLTEFTFQLDEVQLDEALTADYLEPDDLG